MNVARRLISFMLLALLSSAIQLSAAPDNFTNAVRALLRDHIELDRRSVGMVVGVVDEDGQRVVSYGKVDSSAGSPDVNGDTVFEIGSITKTFTALLLEEMVDRGEMKLDDPVANCLQGLARMPSHGGKEITFLHLATHTSGLPSDPDNLSPVRWSDPYAGYTTDRLYEFLSGYHLSRDPGVKVDYSNLGMGLLAEAIARKAGTSFESMVVDRICIPLKMDSTRITLTPELRARAAAGHDWFGKPAADMTFPEPLMGAGAIHSSANDMLKYLSANIGLTPTRLSPLIGKTHVARVGNQALAWSVSGDIVLHGGATFGSSTFVGFDKKRRRGVVVLSNSMYNPVTDLGFLLLNSEWQDDKRPKTEGVNIQQCAALVGNYQITSNYVIGVRYEADRLFMRGSVHLSTELVPDSQGNFFMRVSGTPVTFVRNDQGKVSGLISYMYGYTTNPMSLTKFSDQPPPMAAPSRVPTVANVQSKAYDDCVGQYAVAYGTTVTLAHIRDRLIMKSEGQMTLEFYPESETNFFCPYLPVRLVFIENGKGDVTGLTVATDLADHEFAGKIWLKVRPPIQKPFASHHNLVVAVLVGCCFLLLFVIFNRRVRCGASIQA